MHRTWDKSRYDSVHSIVIDPIVIDSRLQLCEILATAPHISELSTVYCMHHY